METSTLKHQEDGGIVTQLMAGRASPDAGERQGLEMQICK